MVFLAGHPVTNKTEAHILTVVIIVGLLVYALPTIYNFWILFQKAGKPGWAAIIPVYGEYTYAKIAGKPGWLGIVMGLASVINLSNIYFYTATSIIWLCIGLYILPSFMKRYKAKRYMWWLLVLLPILATDYVKVFKYSKRKS